MGAELAAKTEMVRQLRQLAGADPKLRVRLAQALADVAADLADAGRTGDALAYIREAKQIFVDRVRDGHFDQIGLALCLNHEANWLAASNDVQADRIFAEEAALYMSLVNAAPDLFRAVAPEDRLRALVQILQGLLDTNLNAHRFRSAEGAARACVELAKRAAAKNLEAESYLASTYTSLGYSMMGQGKYRDALVEASHGAEIARQVQARYQRDETRKILATALQLVTILARQCGQQDQANAAMAEIHSFGLEPYLSR